MPHHCSTEMPQEQQNICHLLALRQSGRQVARTRQALQEYAALAYENLLLERNKSSNILRTVSEVKDDSRSIFGIEFSSEGRLAATSHTNRSISVIDVATMRKVSQINLAVARTAWTMAFHPTSERILAIGSLSAQVSIYKDTRLIQTRTFESTDVPISSLTFHPGTALLFFAIENRVLIYEWWKNRIVHTLSCHPGMSVRYLRFTPTGSYLITGISKLDSALFPGACDRSPRQLHPKSLLICLLRTTHYLLEHLEITKHQDQIAERLKIWFTLIRLVKAQEREFGETVGESRSVNSSLRMLLFRLNDVDLPKNEKQGKFKGGLEIFDYFRKKQEQSRIAYDLELIKAIVQRMADIVSAYLPDRSDNTAEVGDAQQLIAEMSRPFARPFPSCGNQYSLQAWDIDRDRLPRLEDDWHNVLATCSIHNDATVSISRCGHLVATYSTDFADKHVQVHSLHPDNLGQRLYVYKTYLNVISLSISPSNRYLLIGVRASRVFACVLVMNKNQRMRSVNLWTNSSNRNQINCLKWSSRPGDGIIIGYKYFYLRYMKPF